MAGNGELMRSMRAGGGAGVAAVQELLRRAKAGAVSTAELKEVQTVISSPELATPSRAWRAMCLPCSPAVPAGSFVTSAR